jgi:hypothetical protein
MILLQARNNTNCRDDDTLRADVTYYRVIGKSKRCTETSCSPDSKCARSNVQRHDMERTKKAKPTHHQCLKIRVEQKIRRWLIPSIFKKFRKNQ